MKNYFEIPEEWKSAYLSEGFLQDEFEITKTNKSGNQITASVNMTNYFLHRNSGSKGKFHLSGINALEILYEVFKRHSNKTINNLEIKCSIPIQNPNNISIKIEEREKGYGWEMNDSSSMVSCFSGKFNVASFEIPYSNPNNTLKIKNPTQKQAEGIFNINSKKVYSNILRNISQLSQVWLCNWLNKEKSQIPTTMAKFKAEINLENIPKNLSEVQTKIFYKNRIGKSPELFFFDYSLEKENQQFCSGQLIGAVNLR